MNTNQNNTAKKNKSNNKSFQQNHSNYKNKKINDKIENNYDDNINEITKAHLDRLDDFIQSSLNKFKFVEPYQSLYDVTGKDQDLIISHKSTIPDLVIWNKEFDKDECFEDAFLGKKLNVDIYLAAVIVFVGRMFNNLGIIRRYYVEKLTSRKIIARAEATIKQANENNNKK